MTVFRTSLLAALIAVPICSGVVIGRQDAPAYQERDFLSRVRRLTVEGKRAGEGYWSPDGKRLVFQSEREPGNPFYQIYVLDLASGETTRIGSSLPCHPLRSCSRSQSCALA